MFTFFSHTLPHGHKMAAYTFKHDICIPGSKKRVAKAFSSQRCVLWFSMKGSLHEIFPRTGPFPWPKPCTGQRKWLESVGCTFLWPIKNTQSLFPRTDLQVSSWAAEKGELQRKCSCKPGWLWRLPPSITQPSVHGNPLSNCIIISESNFNCLCGIIRNI